MLNYLTPFFKLINLEDLTTNEQVGFIAMVILAIMLVILFFQALSIRSLLKKQKKQVSISDQVQKTVEVEELSTKISFKDRLARGLKRSRSEVWDKLGSLINGKTIDEDLLEELEEVLYGADIGPETVSELLEELKNIVGGENYSPKEFKKFLYNFLFEKMNSVQDKVDNSLYYFKKGQNSLKTIMIVGVNGAGKTTTIGKLATRLTRQGAKVVVGACDTFRAAAVDQLQVWCDRSGATMIRAKEGTNPSGVAYEALDQAIKQKADYCILDTAGRLHTKGNLMEELAKNKRVLQKLDNDAPQQTLLVLDAITGQNAIRQAEEFHKILDISGLIFTKCDGSSKAGSAISITKKLQVPISYIGVGESVEDLDIFNLDEFLNALLGL